MRGTKIIKLIVLFICLIAFVVISSTIFNNLWGGKPETIEADKKITYSPEMTVKAFGEKNHLLLKNVFKLSGSDDLKKLLSDFNYDEAEVSDKVNKELALHNEESSKNWIKILAKFLFWFGFLAIVFVLMKKSKITPGNRKLLR